MNTRIFHSVNSGLYFRNGQIGLWVDGIHNGRRLGFSDMPEALAGQLAEHTGLFAHVGGVLFTHRHADHFCKEGLDRLLSLPNPPDVYAPGLPESSITPRLIGAGVHRMAMAGVDILAKDTIHEGVMFRETIHQSYLIRMGDETFFLAGDAALTPEEAETILSCNRGSVNAAFVNFYQLVSQKGQEFLRIMKPQRIFLEHLPFEEDDRFHYHVQVKQLLRKLPADISHVEVLTHMAWVDGKDAGEEPLL